MEGYRRLAFMMIDDDVVAVSPSSLYRVLRAHDRLDRWSCRPSKKGTGFAQPSKPRQHWHMMRCGNRSPGALYPSTTPPRMTPRV